MVRVITYNHTMRLAKERASAKTTCSKGPLKTDEIEYPRNRISSEKKNNFSGLGTIVACDHRIAFFLLSEKDQKGFEIIGTFASKLSL